MRKGKLIAALCATLSLGAAWGAGFQLYTEGSTEALGQAGAISGRTNLTSLAWYNPAALAGTDQPSVMLGATLVSIHTDYKDGANDASMSKDARVIPHFYVIQPLTDDVTATLSVNAPYGLITEWPEGWDGATIATYSDLETVYITPSVAWRLHDRFSVGVGVNVVSAKAQLEGTGREVKGDDMSYGGTVSAHYQPLDDWGIGARYQSSVKLDITGTLTAGGAMIPASAELELPPTFNIGVANTSLKNLSLGLDLVWTGWSTYNQLAVVAPPVTPPASEKNWEDVISIRLGGEYALGEAWLLRAGYVWDQSPVPDSTRAPELPGSDRQMVMFGFGWNCWKAMTIDAAYSFLWAKEAPDAVLPGNYETTTHLLGLSVGYDF